MIIYLAEGISVGVQLARSLFPTLLLYKMRLCAIVLASFHLQRQGESTLAFPLRR